MNHTKQLLKTDLHCHLDGSLSGSMMERHLKRSLKPEDIRVSPDCRSLTEYLEKFEIPLQCLQTRVHLKEEAEAFLKEAAKEKMDYMEVRFAPMSSVNGELSCKEVIESVLEGLEKGKEATGIQYQVITCAMRHYSLENNMEMLEEAEKFLGKGVCALDLAGDESMYPNEQFKELFQEASRRKIPFVIHSGETGNVENVRTAVEYGAKRIGHGLALIQDPDLMQEVARRGIGIEMCPSSNLQTRAVSSLKAYPLKKFLDAGIKVSINTDNRTVSHTTLEKELQIIYDLYHDEGIIRQLMLNGMETACCL